MYHHRHVAGTGLQPHLDVCVIQILYIRAARVEGPPCAVPGLDRLTLWVNNSHQRGLNNGNNNKIISPPLS